jgi:predicted transglutaminase-like protease
LDHPHALTIIRSESINVTRAQTGRFNSGFFSNKDEMNIKQSLRTIDEVLTNEIGHFFKGYWPTSDDIGNDKVKSLASRLKAESYKETFTNILEWQERNIVFWTERHPIPTILYSIVEAFVVVFFIGLLSLTVLIIRNIQLLSWLPWFIVIWSVMLVSSVATTLTILIWIIRSNRKFPWKEVPRGLKNAFWPNISMNFLLENKLGVCRDYAKLTACLLSNIYPNAEICFASAPGHVATGINIENGL